MKFITEDELRFLYRKEPFTTYEPEPGTRLTPGARQFLLDRGIDMYDEQKQGPIIRESLTQEICCPSANPNHNGGAKQHQEEEAAQHHAGGHGKAPKKCNWKIKMVAQNLTRLSKQFSDIRHMVEGKGNAMNLPCKECSGITCENFSEDQEDCFEITDFHVQLERGKEILALHRLRCALREIEPVMMQAFEGNDAAIGPCMDAIGKINQIINTVSQMICAAVGGKECQRKL